MAIAVVLQNLLDSPLGSAIGCGSVGQPQSTDLTLAIIKGLGGLRQQIGQDTRYLTQVGDNLAVNR
jgi:hypothetical protein